MTRAIGRVAHPETHGAQWVYDTDQRRYVERTEPNLDELDRIEESVRAINREQLGLTEAVRHARARGFTWARIGVILGVPKQTAQQRFGAIDEELRSKGVELPDDAAPAATQAPERPLKAPLVLASLPAMEPEPAPEPAPAAEPKKFDFSAMAAMTNDEILALAEKLPKNIKLTDDYLRTQREAIVVTLYKREWSQTQIAAVIGKSSQRVSQIISKYYVRMEQEWAAERAQWEKGS